MSTFVLIHGSWQGAWCWGRLTPLLRAQGHTVVASDLPGHGADQTPFGAISLNSYAEAVRQALSACQEPAILVGHGMAGMVITQAAVAVPERVRSLVYLAAFVPAKGQSADELSRGDVGSIAEQFAYASKDGLSLFIPKSIVREALYGDCDPEAVAWALERMRPGPLGPNREAAAYDPEALRSVPTFFVECTRDRAISLARQQQMRRPFKFKGVFTLESDHSPMISHPKELAEILFLLAQISVTGSGGSGVPIEGSRR